MRAVLALGGVPQSDLADGVQQVRLRLLERTASGREAPRDVSAWAAVVASNLAMDWHRAKRRQERLGERLAALRAPAHPSGEETSLLSLAVARGLDELPAAQRQVVVLRFFADLPVRDIAAELGVPEGTVKSRLHTAVRSCATGCTRTRWRDMTAGHESARGGDSAGQHAQRGARGVRRHGTP